MKKRVYICLIILIIWIILIKTNNLEWFDESIYNAIYSFNSLKLTNIMKNITFFANTKTIIVLCLLSLLSLIWKYKDSLYLVCTVITSTILNNLIKVIIRRERPNHFRYIIETTYSFPSGHAMASMSFYGGIIILIMYSNLNKRIKYILAILLGVLIFLIGLSRVYLGAHHASDIIGGWLCSYILLNYTNDLLKRRKNKTKWFYI